MRQSMVCDGRSWINCSFEKTGESEWRREQIVIERTTPWPRFSGFTTIQNFEHKGVIGEWIRLFKEAQDDYATVGLVRWKCGLFFPVDDESFAVMRASISRGE